MRAGRYDVRFEHSCSDTDYSYEKQTTEHMDCQRERHKRSTSPLPTIMLTGELSSPPEGSNINNHMVRETGADDNDVGATSELLYSRPGSDDKRYNNCNGHDHRASMNNNNNNLHIPKKMRVRHVSFEGEYMDWKSMTSEMLDRRDSHRLSSDSYRHHRLSDVSGQSTSSEQTLKPCMRVRSPSLEHPVVDLVRNELSNSPLYVRRNRGKDARLSIASMNESGSDNNSLQPIRHGLPPHHSSHSSLGSYTYLPAVTLPPAYSREDNNNSINSAKNRVLMRPSYSRGRRKRSCVYGERRMSAFETIIQQMARHKESCTQRFCQIYVLLVILQISLGSAVSLMAIYLPITSPTIEYRDATIWSGCPLAISGVVGMAYYMVYSSTSAKSHMKSCSLKVAFIVLSVISALLCTVGCITTGIHGTRIANYHYPCESLSEGTICHCHYDTDMDIDYNASVANKQVIVMELRSCKSEYGCCDLVFTSIKDCLLLECAFNCIGTCISLWLLTLVWRKRLLRDHRRHSSIALGGDLSYWTNGYGT